MERWLSILAVFGCIVALSGCENEKGQAYFNAKVLEVNREYVDIRCMKHLIVGFLLMRNFLLQKMWYQQKEHRN